LFYLSPSPRAPIQFNFGLTHVFPRQYADSQPTFFLPTPASSLCRGKMLAYNQWFTF